MKKLIFVFGLIISISIIISCANEFDFSTDKLSTNIEQNSDFAIPLVNASITLDEILPTDSNINRYLLIDENNFLSLRYEFEFAQFASSDFFNGVYSGADLPNIVDKISPKIVEVGLNNFLNEGEFYLADPRVTISIRNYWDVPTKFKLIDFYYYKEYNSPGFPVTGIIVDDSISVIPPIGPANFAITEIELNNTNSNIADVISAMPHHLSFAAILKTVPGGPYNIVPSSIDSVKLKIEIPMDLRVTNLVLRDTAVSNLGNDLGNDTATVKSLLLNLIVQNGFPVSIDAQLCFADSSYEIFDSTSVPKISLPAGTTVNGKVTESTESLNTVQLENDKMANLLKAKFLITKFTFNTANASVGETVKLYSDYKIGLKIGARIKLKLKT